jgi:hypothetical protein
MSFASDSRTTPGPIDGVSKVVVFRREDIAAVWSGDLRYAAFALSHLDALFSSTDAMRRRDIDVRSAFGFRAVSVRERLSDAIRPLVPALRANPEAIEPGPTSMIVGGYSLDANAYLMLRLDWGPTDGRWAVSIREVNPTYPVYLGDDKKLRRAARESAKHARRVREAATNESWKMEPLRAIQLACEDRRIDTVGGDLQLAKAFRHGSTRTYGFAIPMGRHEASVLGVRLGPIVRSELERSHLLIDTERWLPDDCVFAACSG